MKVIDVKELSNKIKYSIIEKLQDDKFKNIIKPHFVIIQVGDNNYSNIHIKNKKKECEDVGIMCSHYHYKDDIPEDELIDIIKKLSLKPSVTAISIQLPLPDHINIKNLADVINPMKDVDGITITQAGALQLGFKNNRLVPCIAKGIISILESIVELDNKNIVVVGKSNTVGKPVSQLLQEKNAIVTIVNPKAIGLENITGKSDIIILSSNLPGYFSDRYFYTDNNLIIIDAGISLDTNNICGDLSKRFIENSNYIYYRNNWKYITFSEGLELISIMELLNNIYIAYENQYEYIWNYCSNLSISNIK